MKKIRIMGEVIGAHKTDDGVTVTVTATDGEQEADFTVELEADAARRFGVGVAGEWTFRPTRGAK